MALSKKDLALIQDLRERASLTLPPYEKPVEMQPHPQGELIGYRCYSDIRPKQVYFDTRCAYGENKADRPLLSGSQGIERIYETPLLAARAQRWMETENAMRTLGEIDRKIAELEATK